jgi:low affinity Fe/Cu permease
MEWVQFAITLATFLGVFIWNRTENRADIRHMDAKLESTRELVRAIHQEGADFRMALLQESKDFHGRLCAIEERNRK